MPRGATFDKSIMLMYAAPCWYRHHLQRWHHCKARRSHGTRLHATIATKRQYEAATRTSTSALLPVRQLQWVCCSLSHQQPARTPRWQVTHQHRHHYRRHCRRTSETVRVTTHRCPRQAGTWHSRAAMATTPSHHCRSLLSAHGVALEAPSGRPATVAATARRRSVCAAVLVCGWRASVSHPRPRTAHRTSSEQR